MGTPFQLRDYQADLVGRVWDHLQHPDRPRTLAQLPTGGGKTAVLAELVRREIEQQGQVLVAVHRIEILGQIAAAIASHTGIPPELVTRGSKPNWGAPILLGMNQTLSRRLARIPDTLSLMLQDEAHHAVSESYRALYQSLPESCRIGGLTATPERLDGKPLRDVFDVLECGPGVGDLIEAGYLSDYVYLSSPLMTVEGVRTRGGDYSASDIARLNRSVHLAAGVLASYIKHAYRKQTVVFAAAVSHSREIAWQMAEAGINAVSVDGNTPPDERERAIADFRAGKIQVLCNCELFGEGVDIPAVESVILARPTQSLTIFLQQIGRSLRRGQGKDCAIILDVCQNYKRHGLPSTPRNWSLDGREPSDTPTLRVTEEDEVVAVEPGEPLQVFEGNADLIDITALQRQQLQIRPVFGLVSRLVAERKVRGYKPGWCAFRLLEDPIASLDLKNWEELAEELGYKPGWAWHKWQEAKRIHKTATPA